MTNDGMIQPSEQSNTPPIPAIRIPTNVDEFMDIAKMFVTDEYVIRPVTSKDIEEWENYSDYNEEAYAFAEAVIKKYENYYVLN